MTFALCLILVFIGLGLGYMVGRTDRDRVRADEVLDILERIYQQRGKP